MVVCSHDALASFSAGGIKFSLQYCNRGELEPGYDVDEYRTKRGNWSEQWPYVNGPSIKLTPLRGFVSMGFSISANWGHLK